MSEPTFPAPAATSIPRRARPSLWWILPIVLVVLPALLVLVFVWSTPDVATFDYSLF